MKRFSHIPSLDGLRALSFLLVFGSHAGLGWIIPGGFGVTVFFFLSGYLITTLMRQELAQSSTVNLKHFYLRRAFRILPPFYLILLSSIALEKLGVLGKDGTRPMALVSQLLHFSNYYVVYHGWQDLVPGTGPYWSLAVEEHFYLLFPALFILLHKFRFSGKQQAIVLWSICGVVLVWRCVVIYYLHGTFLSTYLRSDTRIDSILFGCALAVYKNPMLDDDSWTTKPGLTLALGVVVLLFAFIVRSEFFRDIFHYTLQGIALTPIFAILIRYPNWLVARPLNWKPVRFVGTLSYSLYLCHQVFLYRFESFHWSPVKVAVVSMLLSFVVALTLYYTVEKPCARLRRSLAS